MKIKKLLLSVLIAIGFLIITSITSNAASNTISYDIDVTEDYTAAYEVLDIVNKERKAEGLSELTMDKDLLSSAMLRAAECAADFSHTRPDGTSCFTADTKAWGENIAAGQSTPEYVMDSWMNSAGHKANILGSRYKTIGIGAIKYGSARYWVQMFGTGNLTEVTTKPTNKEVTRTINMLKTNVELYYNSLSTLYMSHYIKTEFKPVIVIRNPGWEMTCTTIDSKYLNFDVSDKSILTVDKSGKFNFNKGGKIKLKISLKQDSSIYVEKEIEINDDVSPDKVTNVKQTKATENSVKIKWNNVNNATGYKVYLYNKDTDKYEYYNSINKNSITIKDLKALKEYKVKVRAYREIDGTKYNGEKSSKLKVKTAPSKVKKLKSTSKTKNSVKLSWKKISGASGYEIYLYNTKTKKYEYYGKTTNTTFNVKKLKKKTNYKIKVRAYKNYNGNKYTGSYSTVLKVKTK